MPINRQAAADLHRETDIFKGAYASTVSHRKWEDDKRASLYPLEIQEPAAPSRKEVSQYNAEIAVLRATTRAKILQMVGNKTWQQKGPSSDPEFESAPRTFLKTAQEILSNPMERMAFERDDLKDGEDEAIDSIIIDPRCIASLSNNDFTLLRNLGLERFIPKKGSKRAKKIEKVAQAIPEIKDMLKGLEPIKRLDEGSDGDLKYFRLMRMSRGKNAGYVLGTQHIEGKKILFKTDLYDAGRRIARIEAGYEDEIKKLKWIQSVIDSMDTERKDWHDQARTDEFEAIKESLLECAKSLQFVRNEDKKDLRLAIQEICRELEKPHMRRLELLFLNESKSLIGRRLSSIEEIWSYLGKDKAIVNELIAEEQRPLERFLDEVEKLHEQFTIFTATGGIDEGRKDKIIKNLRARRSDAEKLKFEPYLSFAKKFIEQIDQTICDLQSSNKEYNQRAPKEFLKMYLVSKIAQAYKDLEEVYDELSLKAESINPEEMLRKLEEKHQKLMMHKVAAKIETPEYDDAFGEVYHLFNSLKMRLKELLKVEGVTTSEPAKDEAAKKEVKEEKITFSGIIRKLNEKSGDLIGKVKEAAKKVFGFFMRTTAPVPPAPSIASSVHAVSTPKYTPEEKAIKIARMKKRIKDFDFVGLVKKMEPKQREFAFV